MPDRLVAAGLDTPSAAGNLATLLISLLEGAHILCRASGDIGPFDQTASAALELVRAAHPAAAAS